MKNKATLSKKKVDQEVCKYFLEKGECPYNNQCWFKHPNTTTITINNDSKQRANKHPFIKLEKDTLELLQEDEYNNNTEINDNLCKFYLNNCCRFGSNCYNKHTHSDLITLNTKLDNENKDNNLGHLFPLNSIINNSNSNSYYNKDLLLNRFNNEEDGIDDILNFIRQPNKLFL